MRSLAPCLHILLLAAALFATAGTCRAANLTPARAEARIRDRFPAERQRLQDPVHRRDFPRLGSRFEVLAPSTKRYNCIAHSLGIHDRWINPRTGPADAPLAGMDRLYRSAGYRRLRALNFRRQSGNQKVVVYALRDDAGTITRVTHAAIQMADGTWQSKLGASALIRHPTPWAVAGPQYGVPVAVYIRRAAGPSRSAREARRFGEASETIPGVPSERREAEACDRATIRGKMSPFVIGKMRRSFAGPCSDHA